MLPICVAELLCLHALETHLERLLVHEQRAPGLGEQCVRAIAEAREQRRGVLGGRGRMLLAVDHAEPAAHVDVVERYALRRELVEQAQTPPQAWSSSSPWAMAASRIVWPSTG